MSSWMSPFLIRTCWRAAGCACVSAWPICRRTVSRSPIPNPSMLCRMRSTPSRQSACPSVPIRSAPAFSSVSMTAKASWLRPKPSWMTPKSSSPTAGSSSSTARLSFQTAKSRSRMPSSRLQTVKSSSLMPSFRLPTANSSSPMPSKSSLTASSSFQTASSRY